MEVISNEIILYYIEHKNTQSWDSTPKGDEK